MTTKPAKPKTEKVFPTASFVKAPGEFARPDPKCERDPVELPAEIAASVLARKLAITEKEGLAVRAAFEKKAGGKKAEGGSGGTPPAS